MQRWSWVECWSDLYNQAAIQPARQQSVSYLRGISASQSVNHEVSQSVRAAQTDTDGLHSVSISLFPAGLTLWLLTSSVCSTHTFSSGASSFFFFFALPCLHHSLSPSLPLLLLPPPPPPPLPSRHHYQAEYTESVPTCIPAGVSLLLHLPPSISLLFLPPLFFSLPEEFSLVVF